MEDPVRMEKFQSEKSLQHVSLDVSERQDNTRVSDDNLRKQNYTACKQQQGQLEWFRMTQKNTPF